MTKVDRGRSGETNEIDELRRHIVGPEQAQIAQINERLNNPEIHATDISRVLPEAMILRSKKDNKIAKALEPTIEDAIKVSIRKDRQVLVNALFPVMGPAIRKAISSAILGMVQSFNQVLEHSFSIQGLKWRLEALKTRKTFGEVVLLHTLVYQVEQVFLIHVQTGLVLQHVVAKEVAAQDPDMVSGMLTAILDFVQDSFGAEKEEGLDTLRMGGDRSVWIERGNHAMLAAVLRGTPPLDLRQDFNETLDIIHLEQSESFDSFDGDTAPFESSRSHLEECLHAQFRHEKQKTSPLLWIGIIAILTLLGLWLFSSFKDHRKWSDFYENLREEPGIVITHIEKASGKIHIFGFRDPLASDPAGILIKSKLDPDMAVFHLEKYYSYFPEFLLTRIKQMLLPPGTITLSMTEKGVLQAKGSASSSWIGEARRLVKLIPDITDYQDHLVVDKDLKEFKKLTEQVEKRLIFFEARGKKPAPLQEDIINDLVADIARLDDLSKVIDKAFFITIIGHADSSGAPSANMEISWERANALLSILTSKGINRDIFLVQGVGSSEPLVEEYSEEDKKWNRHAAFKVTIKKNSQP